MTKEKFIEQQTKNYLAEANSLMENITEENLPDCVADSSYLRANARSFAENDWADYQRAWAEQTKKDFYTCFKNW